jgi:uncharacterized membrane protein
MVNLRTFFRHYRQLAVIASLIFATLVCIGLLVLRIAYSHRSTYSWLMWNLFLAWLPAFSALVAYDVYKKQSWLKWLVAPLCALVWLIFFPNALYLVTDLIHLHPQSDAPFWFDLILLVAFAWTGFFLGLISLSLMQEILRRMVGTVVSWLFALGVLALSSFGIYLGRFLRWNSWDVFFNPLRLLGDVAEQVRHPLQHFQTLVFSSLFAFFFVAMYLTLMAVTHFRHEAQEG